MLLGLYTPGAAGVEQPGQSRQRLVRVKGIEGGCQEVRKYDVGKTIWCTPAKRLAKINRVDS